MIEPAECSAVLVAGKEWDRYPDCISFTDWKTGDLLGWHHRPGHPGVSNGERGPYVQKKTWSQLLAEGEPEVVFDASEHYY